MQCCLQIQAGGGGGGALNDNCWWGGACLKTLKTAAKETTWLANHWYCTCVFVKTECLVGMFPARVDDYNMKWSYGRYAKGL